MKNKIGNLIKRLSKFKSSEYWEKRYLSGSNSGTGSYGELARFKANIINLLIEKHNLKKCIEFGCGDGNQLQYFNLESYIGFDVSKTAIDICKNKYKGDSSKKFKLLKNYEAERAEIVLSLEVLFHLVELDVWQEHLKILFAASEDFVVIFSSNHNENSGYAKHVRNRNFTNYVEKNHKEFVLQEIIKNKLKLPTGAVVSDFFIYRRRY